MDGAIIIMIALYTKAMRQQRTRYIRFPRSMCVNPAYLVRIEKHISMQALIFQHQKTHLFMP
jgi:hypothetical protein